jgi:pimeloyl-ACP methyl ester carboxylesterase
MLFSLHGASVEAIGQADSYSSKSWAYVVAPTNRRPYGFDWEDWGREDAMEVLDLALDILPVDPNRVYLVGHSMGGHGTWNIAANRPGLFAAIAPSAGWASFYSYGDKPRNDPDHPLYRIFHLCSGPSDTLALAGNLEQLPTFVLHGGADDNVPVSEAQTMVQALQKQNPALVYREIPGKGHWWDESPEPGADCLDLREMIDYLGRHRRHPAPRQVDFVTRALWASRQCRWVTILAQSLAGEASHIVATAFPGLQTFEVQVDNIRAFEIDPESLLPGRPCEITLKIEGQDLEIPWSGTGPVAAEYDESRDRWVPGKKIITMEDQRLESGYAPLKAAMFEPFALVYPTGGAPEERNAFTARARFDAENWWYRGNGYAPLLSDQEFLDAPAGRNPVLFGNSGINRAWDACLEPGPICVNGKSVKIGPLTLSDDSTALVGQYPHRSEDKRMVFVVAGNSPEAAMLTVLVPYFVSGVGLPDFLAFGEQSWLEGVEGAVATGFFGPKWEWIEKATYIRSGAVGEEDAPTN